MPYKNIKVSLSDVERFSGTPELFDRYLEELKSWGTVFHLEHDSYLEQRETAIDCFVKYDVSRQNKGIMRKTIQKESIVSLLSKELEYFRPTEFYSPDQADLVECVLPHLRSNDLEVVQKAMEIISDADKEGTLAEAVTKIFASRESGRMSGEIMSIFGGYVMKNA